MVALWNKTWKINRAVGLESTCPDSFWILHFPLQSGAWNLQCKYEHTARHIINMCCLKRSQDGRREREVRELKRRITGQTDTWMDIIVNGGLGGWMLCKFWSVLKYVRICLCQLTSLSLISDPLPTTQFLCMQSIALWTQQTVLHCNWNETDSHISTVTEKQPNHRALKIPAVKMIVYLLNYYALIRRMFRLYVIVFYMPNLDFGK